MEYGYCTQKARATALAEAGASSKQIMSVGGWDNSLASYSKAWPAVH